MSHFCLSRSSDKMVNSVGLSGASAATAFIWGGASGSEYGKILDIWSPQKAVRITANESSPPPNWIVSYTIPRQHLGATFVGVKPGTTMQETANSIRVAFDTAAAAQSRCGGFKDHIPGTTPGRPTRTAPGGNEYIPMDLWERFLNFTRQFEGPVDFMYNDFSSPQLVTCGIGKMFKDADAAVGNSKYFTNPDGREPSEPEMRADYTAASGLPRVRISTEPWTNLFDFAERTVLRMPWSSIIALLGIAAKERIETMLNMEIFRNFHTFPADAKLACASIAYGSWTYASFAPLREAVRVRNWADAAVVYKSPNWDHNKDEAHKRLFESAAAQGG